MQMKKSDDFYVAAYEMGAEQTPVATWASHSRNPLRLDDSYSETPHRRQVSEVPASFQIEKLFSPDECQRMITLSEHLGYTKDAAVSLPHKIRHNESVVWVIDEHTHDIIWQRCSALIQGAPHLFEKKRPVAINKRFRFYRYSEGDYFRPHTDGAWPGSAIIDEKLITNAYPDRYSQMTFLIFLNEEFEGGETAFYVDKNNPQRPAKKTEDVKMTALRTPRGGVLCFPHGDHPQHCLHGSREVRSGIKYIIRTDLLFSRN